MPLRAPADMVKEVIKSLKRKTSGISTHRKIDDKTDPNIAEGAGTGKITNHHTMI